MKKESETFQHPRKALRWLRISVLTFSLLLSVPLAVLFHRVYSQITEQAFADAKTKSAAITAGVNQTIHQLFANEESRRFEDYSFFSLARNSLVQQKTNLQFSPLSELEPKTNIPALVGYFQIAPDGSVSVPFLPSQGSSELESYKNEIGKDELDRRLQQKSIIGNILAGAELSGKTKTRVPSTKNYKQTVQMVSQNTSNIFQNFTEPQLKSSIFLPSVQTFESTVGEFRCSAVTNQHLLFTRAVENPDGGYSQGFIVNQSEFFNDLLKRQTNNELSLTPALFYRGKNLLQHPTQLSGNENILFQTNLEPPLEQFSVQFSYAGALLEKTKQPIHFLLAVTLLVLTAGVYVLYNFGVQQIQLAEERSNFVSAVTHELKTPLTSIRMYSELLRDGYAESPEKRSSYYDFILQESERLSRLIENILNLSHLQAHTTLRVDFHKVDEILEQVKKSTMAQIERSGFAMKIHRDTDDSLTVAANLDGVIQIFTNLIDNAVKFSATASCKEIEISYSVTPSQVIFSVRDFGPGIPEQKLGKVFDLFYRGEDELTRSTKGTGIGLALAKQFAEAMGGELMLRNAQPGIEAQLCLSRVDFFK